MCASNLKNKVKGVTAIKSKPRKASAQSVTFTCVSNHSRLAGMCYYCKTCLGYPVPRSFTCKQAKWHPKVTITRSQSKNITLAPPVVPVFDVKKNPESPFPSPILHHQIKK